jgi:hypothetical protein
MIAFERRSRRWGTVRPSYGFCLPRFTTQRFGPAGGRNFVTATPRRVLSVGRTSPPILKVVEPLHDATELRVRRRSARASLIAATATKARKPRGSCSRGIGQPGRWGWPTGMPAPVESWTSRDSPRFFSAVEDLYQVAVAATSGSSSG